MKKTHVFEANDGTTYSSASDCRAHENEVRIHKVTKRTYDEVMDAVTGQDRDLADVFERVASMIASNRRANGHLKRAKKQDDFKGVTQAVASAK